MQSGVFGAGTFNTAGAEVADDAKPDAENATTDAKNDFAPQPSNSEEDSAQ